jgi:hypothetical protein
VSRSSIQRMVFGGSQFVALIIDNNLDYLWRIFSETKSELKVKVVDLIDVLKNSKIFRGFLET